MGFIKSIFGADPPAPPTPTPLPKVPTGPSEVEIQQAIADSESARRRRAAGNFRKDTVKTSALGLSPMAGEDTSSPSLLGG